MTRSLLFPVLLVTGGLGLAEPWSALGVEVSIAPGQKQTHETLCVDAKSAAIVGETVDDQPDLILEVMQGMIRKHRCIFVPGELAANVTMKQKVQHVAATDVWEVTWDDETWYVPTDAPREPDL